MLVKTLGLNLGQFIFYIVNFLILVGVLGKFLYKPFLSMLDNRAITIQGQLDTAAETNRIADEKLENYNQQIANAEAKSRKIISDSREQAKLQANRIVDAANEKAMSIIEEAHRDIEKEKAMARVEMKDEIAALALMAAAKIMEKDLSKSGEQEKIVDQIIEEVGKSGWQN